MCFSISIACLFKSSILSNKKHLLAAIRFRRRDMEAGQISIMLRSEGLRGFFIRILGLVIELLFLQQLRDV